MSISIPRTQVSLQPTPNWAKSGMTMNALPNLTRKNQPAGTQNSIMIFPTMQCDFHGKLKVHTSFSFDIFSSKILPVDVGCWELAFFVTQRTAKSRRPGRFLAKVIGASHQQSRKEAQQRLWLQDHPLPFGNLIST